MDFAPCVLCWYQRICLFPLVLAIALRTLTVPRPEVESAQLERLKVKLLSAVGKKVKPEPRFERSLRESVSWLFE